MEDISCEKIYGIDPTKDITPLQVRDAIIDCFYKAHGKDLEQMKETIDFKSEKDFDEFKKTEIESIILQTFNEVNGDFDNPTKEDLIKVVLKLKDHAKFFRDISIIEKHANEIMQLIKKLA
jgi:hypothetical protein